MWVSDNDQTETTCTSDGALNNNDGIVRPPRHAPAEYGRSGTAAKWYGVTLVVITSWKVMDGLCVWPYPTHPNKAFRAGGKGRAGAVVSAAKVAGAQSSSPMPSSSPSSSARLRSRWVARSFVSKILIDPWTSSASSFRSFRSSLFCFWSRSDWSCRALRCGCDGVVDDCRVARRHRHHP
jgi:hypothetical protein